MSELAKRLIEESLRTKNPVLDLGNCGLNGTEPVLKMLGECEHLEELIFSDRWYLGKFINSRNIGEKNELIRLPAVLPSRLRSLVVGNYGVEDGAVGIKNIEILKDLNLLKVLYFRNTQVSDLRPLTALTQLTLLDLRYNEIKDISPLGKLKELKHLNLKNNKINNVGVLGELPQLEKLYLRDNKIADIQGIERLTELRYLDLRQNNVKDLSAIGALGKLHKLLLSDNQITDISPLRTLTSLKGVYLSNNQIVDITALKDLPQLVWLYLSTNQISDIMPLQGLTQLKELYLRNNYITDIVAVEKLTLLRELYLSYNQITNIQYLKKLTDLRLLYLRKNQINDFSPLEGLINLKELYLNETGVSDIEPLKKLKQLSKLELRHNQIQNFDESFLEALPNLKNILLKGNPIKNIPPEILAGNLKKIRNYLQSIENKEDRRPLNEAKLIFVGVGDVGKSELAEAISEPGYKFVPGRETTKGIRIKQWYFKGCEQNGEEFEFTANIWDFAGQEVNYGTHQFFLTKNSVYVFVWETRKGEQTEVFNYWLRIVSLLSDNAPVFIVQNKTDIYESEIDQENWKARFPNIRGFLKTSCKTGLNIGILRELIKDELLELPHIHEIWNKNRFAVRKALENHAADYISKKEYLKICETHNVSRKDAGFLSYQLHDIGVTLHFGDDIKLKNTLVLKPQWATEAAYLLRDSQMVAQGRFNINDLDKIWGSERFADKEVFLLHLMEQFELIFRLQDSMHYIIPELLPARVPQQIQSLIWGSKKDKHLRFEYHYEFMPKGILSRFICRIHELIYQELFWKYGVVLDYEDSRAKVIWDDTGIVKIIAIEVWGAQADKLLFMIRNHLEYIHQKLNNPPFEEKVPCVCPTACLNKATPYLHDYTTLQRFKAKGKLTRTCDKSVEEVSIQAMLEGVLDNKQEDSQRLINLINQNNVFGFFEWIDYLDIQENQVAWLRQEFVHGGSSFQYAEKLKVWVLDFFSKGKPEVSLW